MSHPESDEDVLILSFLVLEEKLLCCWETTDVVSGLILCLCISETLKVGIDCCVAGNIKPLIGWAKCSI